jgi:hypothetical protein
MHASVKAHAPYTNQMIVDPFLYDPTTTIAPPLELSISSDLEDLSVLQRFLTFAPPMILTLGSHQHF